MPDNKLSAKEATLIAQARVELERKSIVPADASENATGAPVARARQAAPVAAIDPVALGGAMPAPSLDAAERIAALMAAARTETERQRRRQRQLYVWAPVAVISVVGLWTLLWMWHKL